MRAVITVIGRDRIGIVYRVSEVLVKYKLNILDISQTLMGDYFVMVTLVDLDKMEVEFQELVEAYEELGKEIGMSIRVQHEELFNQMHSI